MHFKERNMEIPVMTSIGNTSDALNPQDYLHTLNAQFAAVVLPAVVVLGVLMVTGAVGNVIVLYVYSCRMKAGTITRYIQALAVFDLVSCCLAIPGEIIDMTNNYTFGANPLCQTVRTINLFCTLASGSILIVVAIDRYKRICSPLKRQITPRCAMVIIVLCAGVALLVSLPTAVMFGGRTIATDVTNINGTDCSVNDRYVTTILPLAYSSLQMLLFLIGAVILVILYTLIARRIFHHAHLRQRRRSSVLVGRSRPPGASTSLCSSPTPDNKDQQFHFFSNSNQNNNNNNDFRSNSRPDPEDRKGVDTAPTKTSSVLGNFERVVNSDLINEDHGSVERKDVKNILSLRQLNSPDESKLMTSGARTFSKDVHQKDVAVRDIDRLMIGHDSSDFNLIKVSRLTSTRRRSSLTDLKTLNQLRTDANTGMVSKSLVVLQDGFCSAEDRLSSAGHISGDPSPQTFHQQYHHASPPGSPPPTPIEDLDNPSRWLLTSHCHNGDLVWSQGQAARHFLSPKAKKSAHKVTGIKPASLEFSNVTKHSETKKVDKTFFNDRKTKSNKMLEMLQLNKVSDSGKVPMTRNSFTAGKSTQTGDSGRVVEFTQVGNKQFSAQRRGSETFSAGLHLKILTTVTKPIARSSFRGVSDLKSVQTRSETQGTRRTTLMLFSITLIYILSFLPHLVLMTLKALDSLKLHGDSGELLLNLLIRSYFINSASNPIIYSFFSKNFFKECKNALKCVRNKL